MEKIVDNVSTASVTRVMNKYKIFRFEVKLLRIRIAICCSIKSKKKLKHKINKESSTLSNNLYILLSTGILKNIMRLH